MAAPPEISQAVTAVFRAWREARIDFLILRNYEGLPQVTGNDIDVLVAPAQLRRAEQALLAAARQTGFRLHNRAEFATLALFLSHQDSGAELHFDLFTDMKWRGFDFLYCDDFFTRKIDRGLFAIPHPAHEAATDLLAYLVRTARVKDKYKPSIAARFRAEPKEAADLLARTYGRPQAQFLVQASAEEKWKEIEARTGALKRTLVFRQFTRRPWATAGAMLADAARLARRFIRPPGLTVVLCGADGCGKSTAARTVMEGLSATFNPLTGRHFHWKPPLFSARRRAARGPVNNPHDKPVRGRAASLLYFGAHWLEFFLGWPLRIRPVTFQAGLVLMDRFYYDFFVDQRRYRLNVSAAIVRCGYRWLPKPDLVCLLDAPPEVLWQRKQEVPLAETARQRSAYRELVKALPNGVILDASQPPEKVAADLRKVVLDFLVARAGKRDH